MDVNHAKKDQLLRVPGVGPTSAERIVRNRHRHSIDTWRDLTAMGVVRKRAWPFLAFPGHRPPRAKQLRLDLFGEGAREKRQTQTAQSSPGFTASASPSAAPCGERMSCTGCPMLGMPGHPSEDSVSALPMAS